MGDLAFPLDGPRRDPRRLFTTAERAAIAARQHHTCGVCQKDLPQVFHVHHVIPWHEGGPTVIDNGLAVCPEDHAKAPIQPLPAFIPRAWQAEALPEVLPLLRAGEFATLNAAPGAGKTLFSAWAYMNMARVGACARVVVFVPNTHLRVQWVDDLKTVGVYLSANSTT